MNLENPALSVTSLRKAYGSKLAVDGVSFHVKRGEIVGLLGPNGAGKTTTISMLLGVLSPSGGEVLIGGLDVVKQRSAALSRTNFAAVYAPLPGNLTVAQNLNIFAMLYGVKGRKARIGTLLKELDLEQFRDTKCGVLSSGEQTRVALAKAVLNRPELLLLDEPTASLDPSTARDIRARIKSFAAEGSGVLWTSHNMQEVEAVCNRVLFMSKGKILLEGNPRTLPAEHGKATLEDLFIAVAREPLSLEVV
jgi:ABC-2 type transport system ATP-binding protein